MLFSSTYVLYVITIVKKSYTCMKIKFNRITVWSMHEKFVHVTMEVGVSHEWGTAVCWKVTANSWRVSGSTRIQHHTKLVVVDVIGVSTDFAQVILHIYSQLEFGLYNINQSVLRYGSLSRR